MKSELKFKEAKAATKRLFESRWENIAKESLQTYYHGEAEAFRTMALDAYKRATGEDFPFDSKFSWD